MRLLDLTLPTPQENLACDEALFAVCDDGHGDEVLRFWESPIYFVVLGYSSKAANEANLEACRARGTPILRRCTGGGTVLQGPGCLNYALILKLDRAEPSRGVTETNCYVMRRHQQALQPLWPRPIEVEGYTDLAAGGWKFSGNAQRRGRRSVLFHGTFLLRFDVGMIETLLPEPSRQPPYRRNRSHALFLRNLSLPLERVKQALARCWQANGALQNLPTDRITILVSEKYNRPEWNFKF